MFQLKNPLLNPVKLRIKLIECLNQPCYFFGQDFMYKQVHYLLNLLNNCTLQTNTRFNFVRLLLCYRLEEEREGRREVCLVLDFKMNIIKWKLHFVSCNFGLRSNL